MSLERIVITFDPDGTLRGISSQDFDGLPHSLTEVELKVLGATIDSGTVARITAFEQEKATAVAAREAEKQVEVDAALAREAEALKPERIKQAESLERQAATALEEAAKLRAQTDTSAAAIK